MDFVDTLEPRQFLSAADIRTSTHNWAVSKIDTAVDRLGRTITAGLYRTHQQIGVTRTNADGSVDKTFGKNGIATLTLSSKPRTSDPFEITVDHAGRVLVAIQKRLTRLTTVGAPDKVFGQSGTLTVPVLSRIGDLTVDARDRPVVTGYAKGKTGNRATIIRLGTRGVLDTGFGIGGAYKTPVPADPALNSPGNATGVAVKVFSDGRIVGVADLGARADYGAGGYNDYDGVWAFRLAANGSLDTSYGTNGFTTVMRGGNEVTVSQVAFAGFNSDGGLTIETATTTYSAGDPVDKTTRTRLTIDGQVGKT